MPRSQRPKKRTDSQIHSDFVISVPNRDTGRMFIDQFPKKGKTKFLIGKVIIDKGFRYVIIGKDSEETGRYVVDKF